MTQDDVLFGYRLQLFDLAGATSLSPASARPRLIGDEVAHRVVLEVSQSFRDELGRVRVHGRHPIGAVDDPPVDSRPQRGRALWILELQRSGTLHHPVELRVADEPVAVPRVAAEELG